MQTIWFFSGAVAGLVFASPPADAVDKMIQHVKSDGKDLFKDLVGQLQEMHQLILRSYLIKMLI